MSSNQDLLKGLQKSHTWSSPSSSYSLGNNSAFSRPVKRTRSEDDARSGPQGLQSFNIYGKNTSAQQTVPISLSQKELESIIQLQHLPIQLVVSYLELFQSQRHQNPDLVSTASAASNVLGGTSTSASASPVSRSTFENAPFLGISPYSHYDISQAPKILEQRTVVQEPLEVTNCRPASRPIISQKTSPSRLVRKVLVNAKIQGNRMQGRKIYFCISPGCDSGFGARADFKAHDEEYHEQQYWYVCKHDDCDNAKFAARVRYVRHHKAIHDCANGCSCDIEPLQTKVAWGCGFCGKALYSLTDRAKHIADHYDKDMKRKEDWDHSQMIEGLLNQYRLCKHWASLKENNGYRKEGTSWVWDPRATEQLQRDLEYCDRLESDLVSDAWTLLGPNCNGSLRLSGITHYTPGSTYSQMPYGVLSPSIDQNLLSPSELTANGTTIPMVIPEFNPYMTSPVQGLHGGDFPNPSGSNAFGTEPSYAPGYEPYPQL
ncbi:hypothetical protein MMC18_009117 [Xylographa bjoerkii]|nr:hypothetical protein [Xylographa bjoerkii]